MASEENESSPLLGNHRVTSYSSTVSSALPEDAEVGNGNAQSATNR